MLLTDEKPASAAGRTRQRVLSLVLLGASLVFCLALAEIGLRVFDPLPFRVRGNTLRLNTNIKTTIDNTVIPRMDKEIHVSRNSLGFRGPEMPADYASKISLYTVGGSTTECYYISDGATWPDRLRERLAATEPDLWLNNAGLDGHSTFGHIQLMKQILIPLKPKVLLFLIGVNDLGAETANQRDDQTFGDCSGCPLPRRAFNFLAQNTQLGSTALNFQRAMQARRLGLTHKAVDLTAQPHKPRASTPDEIAAASTTHRKALERYRERIDTLLALCRDNHIVPVLVTQPALFGPGKDPVTGTSLETVVANDSGMDGLMAWSILELYNDVTREAGKQPGVIVVDLARELPKTYDYFYDFIHYTNRGADAVSEVLARNLAGRLPRRHE